MQIIDAELIAQFAKRHADARNGLAAWMKVAQEAAWYSPQDIKNRWPRASIVSNNRFVFDIKGNEYRLLVQVNFRQQIITILDIGTHQEYDTWNL